jgi:hypothetical protein
VGPELVRYDEKSEKKDYPFSWHLLPQGFRRLGLISQLVLWVGANKDFEGRGFLLVVVLL